MSQPNSIKAVIFDWAGTTVDYGSRAPAQVFIEIFHSRGVDITTAEARGPMGRSKHDHISTVANLPRVSELWKAKHGHTPTEEDVMAMYEDFLPLQKATLATGSDVIPGVVEAIDELRSRGIKIGSNTGYTLALMEVVIPIAAKQGYSPDAVVCSDEVPAGRPAPWMNFLTAQRLGIYPMSQVIAVDDTPVGIQAAKNTGAIAIAVTKTGNGIGLSQAEVEALPADELKSRITKLEADFRKIGADHVVESICEIPELISKHYPG